MLLFVRLAWRNIWRHRSRTAIVVVAISISLLLMTVYQGLVSGMEQSMYANVVKVMGGNIQVRAPGYADDISEFPMLPLADAQTILAAAPQAVQVLAATRRINTGGMVSTRQGTYAVQIVGVEPEAEAPVSVIGQHISQGRNLTADDRDAVLIGQGLADIVEAGVGDRITVAGRATHNQMRSRTMTVVGIYDLGMAQIEKSVLYMSLATAGSLYLSPGQVTEVVIWMDALGQEDALVERLAAQLPEFEVASWRANFPELDRLMAIARIEMEVIGLSMLGIASIGTLNLMLMAVYERTREIGVLAALGLKPNQISRLFMLEGALMGAAGAALGLALGLTINAILGQIGIDYSAYVDTMEMIALIGGRVYPSLGLQSAPLHLLMAMGISVLAAYFPARQAARREPATALHFV